MDGTIEERDCAVRFERRQKYPTGKVQGEKTGNVRISRAVADRWYRRWRGCRRNATMGMQNGDFLKRKNPV